MILDEFLLKAWLLSYFFKALHYFHWTAVIKYVISFKAALMQLLVKSSVIFLPCIGYQRVSEEWGKTLHHKKPEVRCHIHYTNCRFAILRRLSINKKGVLILKFRFNFSMMFLIRYTALIKTELTVTLYYDINMPFLFHFQTYSISKLFSVLQMYQPR